MNLTGLQFVLLVGGAIAFGYLIETAIFDKIRRSGPEPERVVQREAFPTWLQFDLVAGGTVFIDRTTIHAVHVGTRTVTVGDDDSVQHREVYVWTTDGDRWLVVEDSVSALLCRIQGVNA